MPGIVALVDLLSIHATTQLVSAGYVAQWNDPAVLSLTVASITNATPMVVTCTTPHGIRPNGEAASVVISGVVGTTAANNFDDNTANESSTAGMNIAWYAVPVSDVAFALYSVDPTGTITASTGNAAYVSGGIVRKAFTDGCVLLGREHIFEQSAPPRVALVPVSSQFGPKSVSGGTMRSPQPSAQTRREFAQRSIATETVFFEVHVWGAATPRSPRRDFDATQFLYQQIIRSAHLLGCGIYTPESGQWTDQREAATQIVKLGHEFVFGLTFATPILDRALAEVPRPLVPVAITNLQPSDGGSSEVGCSDA